MKPRIIILRGHQVNPWELGPWEELGHDFDVRYLATRSGWFDASALSLPPIAAPALRDLLPRGRIGDMAVRIPGDRHLGLAKRLEGAAVVHSQELGYWYSNQAAALKRRLGFKLVLTVWETIPFRNTYRNARTRPYRRRVLSQTDLFLAATERAQAALLLEGAPKDRVWVTPPGVDLERFRTAAGNRATAEGPMILSPGRLVWEKGHQDVLRALAALRSGLVRGAPVPRLVIAGQGPDRKRLGLYAKDLGVEDLVDFRRFVPYDEMPALFAAASCVVLASLPQCHWEEQFGMVLAEAMAAGTTICATTSGAIPEVVGESASLFAPGDWLGLARLLATGPLARPPAESPGYPDEMTTRYSNSAAAERLAAAYDHVLD